MTENETETPSRFRDPVTAQLGILASEWESLHKAMQASTLRARHVPQPDLRELIERDGERLLATRDEVGKMMMRLLKKHPLHEWMTAHRGFPKGAHTARLLSAIGDPLRFPGRVCAEKHHLPEDYAGDACPVAVYADSGNDGTQREAKQCGARVGSLRRGTGTRALWHYCGYHVTDDGRFPKQRRGVQGTWNPAARDALHKPDIGIMHQLIRSCGGVEPWVSVYREKKERLVSERGAEVVDEIDGVAGSSHNSDGAGIDHIDESGARTGLRPFQIDKIARVVAVKAMLGDLLAEWKRVARLDVHHEIVTCGEAVGA